nr:myb-like domain, Myb/SANT-like DNA-binding domain protein [Tanacetum cinerariifolium]
MATRNVDPEPQAETVKVHTFWSQDEELLLAESFIQIFEDPRIGSDQKSDTFWYRILDAYNDQVGKRGFSIRTKNILTGKWTPMNREVSKFNSLVNETKAMSKHKWNNPESTNARRKRHRVTNNVPELFGDDELPRPAGLHRIAKRQRSSNSTASSGSTTTIRARPEGKNGAYRPRGELSSRVKLFKEGCRGLESPTNIDGRDESD